MLHLSVPILFSTNEALHSVTVPNQRTFFFPFLSQALKKIQDIAVHIKKDDAK